MTQVAEKLQPWVARSTGARAAARAGCRICASAARRASPRSGSRPCATRSGASPTSRRSPRPSSGRRRRRALDRGRASTALLYARRAATGWSSSTAASRRSCRALHGLPAGVRVGSLATAVTRAGRHRVVQRYLGQLADLDARAFAALNTAFVARRRVRLRARRRRARAAAAAAVRVDAADGRSPIDVAPADADRARRTQPGADRRDLRRRAGRDGYLHQRRDRGVRRRERGARSLQGAAGERRRRSTSRSMHVHAARSANFSSHSFTLGGKLVRNDAIATLDGEGAECTLNGLYLADGERLVDNHTTIDHAKAHCPSHEIYKGILGGQRARGVQRQDHRPAGRAEDRRQADQPRAAAVRRRADQHQAAARDLRRRREVHARRGDRPARRGRAVLPARPRPDATSRRATC